MNFKGIKINKERFLDIMTKCLKQPNVKRITFRNCIFLCDCFSIFKDIFYDPQPLGLTFDLRGNSLQYPDNYKEIV